MSVSVLHCCGNTGRRTSAFTGGRNVWEGNFLEVILELGIEGLSKSLRLRESTSIIAATIAQDTPNRPKAELWADSAEDDGPATWEGKGEWRATPGPDSHNW